MHLDPERLSALADEPPTPDEAAHLAECLACRREREAYVALLALAREVGADEGLTDVVMEAGERVAPLADWEGIAAALRRDGLVREPVARRHTGEHAVVAEAEVVPITALGRTGEHAVRRGAERSADRGGRAGGADVVVLPARPAVGRPPRVRWPVPLQRAAAALLLLAGGAVLGRATAATGAGEPAGIAAAGMLASDPRADVGGGLGTPVADVGGVDGGGRAALPSALPAGADFQSVPEAMAVLAQAQRDYQRAAAWLSVHDTTMADPGAPEALRARLAALDGVMPTVREALREAPQDPVLNQVYLTAYDVRESTLRQLGRALPVGVRLEGY